MYKPTHHDLEILAKTIYGEARGTNEEDRRACALVIRNRAEAAEKHYGRTGNKHPLFGDGSIAEVCTRPYQFSCWNANDPNCKKIHALKIPESLRDDVFLNCFIVAYEVLYNELPDFTKGSLHYHTINMGWPRAWGEKKEPVFTSSHHHFYNNVD